MINIFQATSCSTKIIGIIGGGQLGKMMILEGKKLSLRFIILDPDPNCPAASIADEQIIGSFHDQGSIEKLAEKSDVMTYEFEHINSDFLIQLEERGYPIHPSPLTLKMIQNKYDQKQFLYTHNISVPSFQKIDSLEDIYKNIEEMKLPALLKTCHGGYDGRGNYLINKKEDIRKAYEKLSLLSKELMLEAYIPFQLEVSAIVARSLDGKIEMFPLAENIHRENILHRTIAPARVSKTVEQKIEKIVLDTMSVIQGAGLFCIEMFIDLQDKIYVNEIAPRPHNSGHYTMEGCNISQFHQHIRAILQLPLATPYLIKPSLMINILGKEGREGIPRLEGIDEALTIEDVYIHYYGKSRGRPRRKMGHVTILGDCIEELLTKVEKVEALLKVNTTK